MEVPSPDGRLNRERKVKLDRSDLGLNHTLFLQTKLIKEPHHQLAMPKYFINVVDE